MRGFLSLSDYLPELVVGYVAAVTGRTQVFK
jgi:hypothetical protein